jgi:hypothetical protein
MNLQEQISRIQSMMGTINESKKLPSFIRRRFTEEELDHEFEDALDYTEGLYERIYGRGERTLENYIRLTMSVLMDNLHPLLTIRIGEDVEWYENVQNILKEYYKDRITKKYNSR